MATSTLQIILATVKALQGRARASAYTLQAALLQYYEDMRLYPTGVTSDIPAVKTWALKHAVALKKLVSGNNMVLIVSYR